MKHLSTLSPAESLIVLKGRYATLKELLKVTFMDLVLKKVIRTFEVERPGRGTERVRIYKYVEAGENFELYQPLHHEKVILSPLYKSKTVQILFRHFVKMSYQNARSENAFQQWIRKSPNLENYFSRNFFHLLLGGFSVTTLGMGIKEKIAQEINDIESSLPGLIASNPDGALDILKEIKGNVYLLENIPLDGFQQLDFEFLKEMNRQGNNSSAGCSGCWTGFDDFSLTFNSSCSGDSGCSGGGGSGCSGCGSGCGGCGGGD